MSEQLYRQQIIDHYKYPRNFGKIKKYTHAFGHQNISCGDQLQFRVFIERGKIKNIGFTGEGCAISIASASLLSEHLIEKSFALIDKLKKKDIEKLLGIPISGGRELCAMLALETVKRLKKR